MRGCCYVILMGKKLEIIDRIKVNTYAFVVIQLVRTNNLFCQDTSLDHYIPCFVKKIKGMKPFLIDIKPATTFRRTRGNMSNSYDRQYSSTKNEGTSRNFSDPYSTTPAPDFGNSSNCTSWSLDPRNKVCCIFVAHKYQSTSVIMSLATVNSFFLAVSNFCFGLYNYLCTHTNSKFF